MATQAAKSTSAILLSASLLLIFPSLTDTTTSQAAQRAVSNSRLLEVERADFSSAVIRARESLVRVAAVGSESPQPVGSAVAQRVRPVARVASGVVIDAQGDLVTSAWTVVGATELKVRTYKGVETDAKLLGFDPHTGLALLRIREDLVPPLTPAPANSLRNGATALTLGYTYGQVLSHDVGLIAWRYQDPVRTLLQMTNALLPGHIGGAAIDEEGRMIGVIVADLSPKGREDAGTMEASQRGQSFAIPVDVLTPLVEELRNYGTVRRGYLGVRVDQGWVVDPERPEGAYKIGVAVTEVIEGGPAWKAGLRAGDLVVAVADEAVNSPDELMELVVGRKAGSSVKFVWVREGIRQEHQVVLAATPESVALRSMQSPSSNPILGHEQLKRALGQLDALMDSVGVKPVPAR